MVDPAPTEAASGTFTTEEYFGLVAAGLLGADDRVELLEGVVVAMSPRNPPHDTAVSLATAALLRAVGERAAVRSQCALVLGRRTVPEPDVAVVPGRSRDYARAHPTGALLVLEVADSTLPQDRLTKARIYAAAEVPEYWIVNLRDGVVEVARLPDPAGRRHRERSVHRRGDTLELVALPGVRVVVEDLLPE